MTITANDMFIQQSYLLHRNRILNAKKTVDTSKPTTRVRTANRTTKAHLAEAARQSQINDENRRLVSRIQTIEASTSNGQYGKISSTAVGGGGGASAGGSGANGAASAAPVQRRRKFQRYGDMYKLMVDNTAMVNRLIHVPPTQSRKKWAADSQKHDELLEKLKRYKSDKPRPAPGLECTRIEHKSFAEFNRLNTARSVRTSSTAHTEPVLLAQHRPREVPVALRTTLREQMAERYVVEEKDTDTEVLRAGVLTDSNDDVETLTIQAEQLAVADKPAQKSHKSTTSKLSNVTKSNVVDFASTVQLYDSFTVIRMQGPDSASGYGLTSVRLIGVEKLQPHRIELSAYHPELQVVFELTVSVKQLHKMFANTVHSALLKSSARQRLVEKVSQSLLFVPDDAGEMSLVLELDDDDVQPDTAKHEEQKTNESDNIAATDSSVHISAAQ